MDALLERLTQRQLQVYEFIRDKIQNRGYGPTVREIGDHFSISSPNGVMCHLKALEKKGLILRSPNKSRAIELTIEAARAHSGLPLMGRVAAGVLHEAVDQDERIDFDDLFVRPGCFVLQIHGDSMVEAYIADGDYVIVDPRRPASVGAIVVAQTPDGEATVKYWFPEKGRIRLQPANSQMKPIYVDRAEIKGTVVGVVRKMT